jgi:hypothetical protein
MSIAIAIYGESGVGKSLDVHRTLMGKTLTILTERGGLNSVTASLGKTPQHLGCYSLDKPLDQMEELIDGRVTELAKKKAFGALVVDSGSELGLRHTDYLIGQKTQVQQAFYATQIGLRRLIRKSQQVSALTVWIFHAQEPETKMSGEVRKGGPALPGRLSVQVPYMFDMVLRAAYNSELGEEGRRRVYLCDSSDESYIMKDRFRACDPMQDMALKPILAKVIAAIRGRE